MPFVQQLETGANPLMREISIDDIFVTGTEQIIEALIDPRENPGSMKRLSQNNGKVRLHPFQELHCAHSEMYK